jgi:hypothetical protein
MLEDVIGIPGDEAVGNADGVAPDPQPGVFIRSNDRPVLRER